MAWWYVAVYVGVLTVNASLLRRSPDLLKERSSVKPDAKGWDRWLAPLVSVYGQTAVLVVAGLERRFGWSVGFAVWL